MVSTVDRPRAQVATGDAILHGVFKDFSEVASVKLFCAVQLVHEIVDGYREASKPSQGDGGAGPNRSST